ncbi:hypothetical protein AX17_006774 [Amanita inopinata Kibby_2008]|nr:hypothetical protein AX17_006774 [Amanita inopinata Kibby_2008]
MLRLMNELTDKPDWHKKVFNREIVSKWKKEVLEADGVDISQAMVDWCIEELRYKAKIFEKTGMVTVYDADVVKSDVAVPQELKEPLKDAVRPLEDVAPTERDWHPGSDERVLDLVHPSLFPLVYGRSRILPDGVTNLDNCIRQCGEGVTLTITEEERKPESDPFDAWVQKQTQKTFSRKFQWLPCDANIANDDVKITSYINNLHPHRHKNLYSLVERIIGCAIPLWNVTLTGQKVPQYRFQRISYKRALRQGQSDEEDNVPFTIWDEEALNTPAMQPEPEIFKPPTVPDDLRNKFLQEDGMTLKSECTVDLKRDYGERGLQVIVKLANIHLTPEKPEYEGGTWHVEGQLNEHICATALYYYDSENISTSCLAFRQQSSAEDVFNIRYQQDYHRWLGDVFGCEQEGPPVQDVGTVNTKEGRLLTFPNVFQHRVQPFRLADPTKPGHRKILAMFLVDPNIRIISTANVPCQRIDWWRDAVSEEKEAIGRSPLLELKDDVCGPVGRFAMTMEEAKELRLELMEERKQFVIYQNEAMETWETFSLCEH